MDERVQDAPEAGPSSIPASDMKSNVEMIEIPSSGLEFFEYRRRLFMAGIPPPTPDPNQPFPKTYLVPKQLPSPIPTPTRDNVHPPIARIDATLSEEGAIGSRELWEGGVRSLAEKVHNGKKFARGMRLGLVIKILISSWINDGLWPIDSVTGLPEQPPASPIIAGEDLFPEAIPPGEEIYSPPRRL